MMMTSRSEVWSVAELQPFHKQGRVVKAADIGRGKVAVFDGDHVELLPKEEFEKQYVSEEKWNLQ